MGQNKSLLFLTALTLAFLISACSGSVTTASSWPGVFTDGQTAYVAYNQQVYAINLQNGSLKWRFPEEINNAVTFYAEPAITPDGQLIVGGYNHVLYSLNPDDGKVIWEFREAQNRFIAAPLVFEDGIYAPAADETLYALTLDGQLRWKFVTEEESWATPVADGNCKCLFLPSLDHHVYAISLEDGTLIWQSESLDGAIVGTPALGEDHLLHVGTFSKAIVAIDTASGRTIWRTPTEGWVWAGPILKDGRLYAGDLNGFFYALNASDGSLIWQLSPEQLDGQIVGSPLIIDESLFVVTENGTLYNISIDGKINWSQVVGGKLYTSPRQAGDLILVAPVQSAELLIAYSKQGVKQWSYTPEK